MMSAWLRPLRGHVARSAADSETFYRFTRETVLPQLQRLREEFKRRGQSLKQQLSEAQGKLSRQHESLTAAVAAHEASWRTRMKLGEGPHQDPAEAGAILDEAISVPDIFVTEQALRQQVAAFLREKGVFADTLLGVFRATRSLEHETATAAKDIIGEAMRVRGQQLAASAELLTEGALELRSAEALVEWGEALRVHRLDWEWQLEVPPPDGFMASMLSQVACQLGLAATGSRASSTTPPSGGSPVAVVRPIRVTKCGFLARPATFSRSWTVVFVVLTDSAFLHCYLAEDLAKIEGGAPSTGSPRERPLRIPSPSMRLHGKALSELNQNAARIVLAPPSDSDATTIVSGLARLTPTLSIPLLHAQTTVTPDGKAAGEFSFTILVPGGTSFFGRSERKYALKSFVEEDMVDWCIAIKEAIATAQQHTEMPPTQALPPPAAAAEHGDYYHGASGWGGDEEAMSSGGPRSMTTAMASSSPFAAHIGGGMSRSPFEAAHEEEGGELEGVEREGGDYFGRRRSARGAAEALADGDSESSPRITSPVATSPIGEMENPWDG